VGAHALSLSFDPASGEVVSITKLRIAATFDKPFQTASRSRCSGSTEVAAARPRTAAPGCRGHRPLAGG